MLARNPFLRDSLLIGQSGERIISKVTPTLQYNSVDQPIFPTTGKRLVLSADLAGLGGNTKFIKPTMEAVSFFRQNSRMSIRHSGRRSNTSATSPTHASCRFSKSSFSAANTAFAASTLRIDRPAGPEHRPGARRQQEPVVQRRADHHDCRTGPPDSLLRRRPGARHRPGFALKEDVREIVPPPVPPLVRSATSVLTPDRPGAVHRDHHDRATQRVQDVDRRRGSLLHAGAERAVPADLCLQPAARRCAEQPACSRRKASSSGSPSARPSDKIVRFVVHERIFRNERFRSCLPLLVVERGFGVRPGRRPTGRSGSSASRATCPDATASGDPRRPLQPPAPAARSTSPFHRRPPFPAGAKAGFVNLQAIAQMTTEGKAAAAKVNALATKEADRRRRQGQGAAGQSDEAADQRQRDERHGPRRSSKRKSSGRRSRDSGSNRTRRPS